MWCVAREISTFSLLRFYTLAYVSNTESSFMPTTVVSEQWLIHMQYVKIRCCRWRARPMLLIFNISQLKSMACCVAFTAWSTFSRFNTIPACDTETPAPDTLCYMGTQGPVKTSTALPTFRPMSILAKQLDGSRCHMVWWHNSAQAALC